MHTVSDGYCYREQVGQLTNREGMHIAQVSQMALHENGESENSAMGYPENKNVGYTPSFIVTYGKANSDIGFSDWADIV